jgi:hypothetical protein
MIRKLYEWPYNWELLCLNHLKDKGLIDEINFTNIYNSECLLAPLSSCHSLNDIRNILHGCVEALKCLNSSHDMQSGLYKLAHTTCKRFLLDESDFSMFKEKNIDKLLKSLGEDIQILQ